MEDNQLELPAGLTHDLNRRHVRLFSNPPRHFRSEAEDQPQAQAQAQAQAIAPIVPDLEAGLIEDQDQLLPVDNDEDDDGDGMGSISSSQCYEPGSEGRIHSPAYWGQPVGVLSRGNLEVVNLTWESMNFHQGQSHYRMDYLARTANSENRFLACLIKLLLVLWIGTTTALAAFSIEFLIRYLSNFKYAFFSNLLSHGITRFRDLTNPLALILAINGALCGLAGLLGVWKHLSVGSGIPHIKAYLNGIKISGLMCFSTLVSKYYGVIVSVVGGFPVGKEGPMIHLGAGMGAGLTQGMAPSLNIYTNFFRQFRNDLDKREFVGMGAAAGVSAAFGAPISGIIFAIEEGLSHFNPTTLFWLLICSCQSFFVLNLGKSYENGSFGDMSNGGLINFGKFSDASYQTVEFLIFVAMGVCGGCFGALFNQLNKWITTYRSSFIQSKKSKVFHVLAISLAVTNLAYYSMMVVPDCKPRAKDFNPYQMQLYCNDGEYHAGAAIWFATPENSVKDLFHAPVNNYNSSSLIEFVIVYFLISVFTYGISISSGLFIPSLLIGAAWGRLVGIFLQLYFPAMNFGDVGKYALVGASAQLAGTVRIYITICCIMMEATGNLTYAYPIIISCVVATCMGNLFNEGIYEIHNNLAGMPLLAWTPPKGADKVQVSEICARPVICLQRRMRVKEVVDILENCPHGGFPVVDPPEEDEIGVNQSHGRLRGFMLRHHVVQMILAAHLEDKMDEEVSWESYANVYPTQTDIYEIYVSDMLKFTGYLDFSKIMDPAPTTVKPHQSLDYCYQQFRMVGMRHMIVVNDLFDVVGIVTRKDLYRVTIHKGQLQFKTPIIPGKPKYIQRFMNKDDDVQA
ncbi:hypothetical protein TCAL_00408 [Tigriopus californicus]|uniref:Chloride channel protein n=1 Tax=Tigriopus californicus TaxID=6832 RepID=A0A553NDS1_TIGCA|nr:H(+)/Cl(-) exchange transporter 7-like [Tigriopus californicus]TRY63499.1 hypothetical protein TCAL_00408 [Tigriopus californicus]|eukprot:TCALIF_00408-PA protein Name:"Similar to Clcn7 H(+)/Cl(-) exchange transporter 7 (Mus musculus)" AED:0.14 eAED:0.14 QI:501/1/1/1/1/1/5/239/852